MTWSYDDRFVKAIALLPVIGLLMVGSLTCWMLDEAPRDPDIGPDARRAEREAWLARLDPEVIAAQYLALVREIIGDRRWSQGSDATS